MTKQEFLEKLRHALANDLSGAIVQENVDYYNQYINEEVAKGRSEQEVVDELGDPWVLAQTTIHAAEDAAEAAKNTVYDEYSGKNESYDSGNETGYGTFRSFNTADMPAWKKVLATLAFIMIAVLLVIVVGGIVGITLRFLFPIILVVLAFKLIRNIFS